MQSIPGKNDKIIIPKKATPPDTFVNVNRRWQYQLQRREYDDLAANYFGDKSDGDLSTTGDVNLSSTQDGDIIVKNYGNLTINTGHTLTVTNRCRGLLLFVDGDLTVDGTISMTARGCHANPADSGVTGDTPVAPGDGNGVGANGVRFPFLTAAGSDTLAAAELEGTGTALYGLISNFPALDANGDIIAFPRVGGAGAPAHSSGNGTNGTAGSTNQSGGGGSGSENAGTAGGGTAGTCFSGGSGGAGAYTGVADNADAYGGQGGTSQGVDTGDGAGNPRGSAGTVSPVAQDGTGGFLMIICSGSVTVGASGSIEANGANGGRGAANQGCGGGSGGGVIGIIYGGSYSNSGTVEAAGGSGENDGYTISGNGGAGTIQTLQVLV